MAVQIIAHRGASYLANHENTIEAFQLAIDTHAEYVEFDVRQTLDKQLIIFHNEQINGMAVASLTYQEINQFAQKQGYQIPLFSDALALCKDRIKLDIEIKEPGFEKRLLAMLKEQVSYDSFMIKSFLDIVVRRVKKMDSQVTTGLLLGVEQGTVQTRFNEYFPKRRIEHCMADFISPNYRLATPEFLFRMRKAHLPVYVWTVNSPKTIQRFLEQPVAGIITDRPDVAVYFRRQLQTN